MYPAIPVGSVATGSLAVTGFPIASLLILATVLVVAGLLLFRGSRMLRPEAP